MGDEADDRLFLLLIPELLRYLDDLSGYEGHCRRSSRMACRHGCRLLFQLLKWGAGTTVVDRARSC